MRKKKPQTSLSLPFRVVTMAKMAAARLGVSLSDYVAGLILEDSVKTGIEAFLNGEVSQKDVGEAGHAE